MRASPSWRSIRQVAAEQGRRNVLFIHVPLIVQIPGSDELKSKPTQHSVKELLSIGIQPDILVCRSDTPFTEEIRRKISLFCNVDPSCVIQNSTASTLYEVPLMLAREGLDQVVCERLQLDTPQPDLTAWSSLVKQIKGANRHVQIALVGKYTQLHDAYLSVVESLFHAGTANDAVVSIKWVDSEEVTADNAKDILSDCDGILVPGGFGDRGIEGMIAAAQYARTTGTPYLGICLGMQIAVIEFARHVAGLTGAHSAEFDEYSPTPWWPSWKTKCISLPRAAPCVWGNIPVCWMKPANPLGCTAAEISERHRHRYEFNNEFRQVLTEEGMLLAGLSPDGHLVEVVEAGQATSGLWDANSIPNSRAARTELIPCSSAL
ncbi:MAG: CTP synthase [Oscillospiraceae bacterium]